jgi:hypothetical protein
MFFNQIRRILNLGHKFKSSFKSKLRNTFKHRFNRSQNPLLLKLKPSTPFNFLVFSILGHFLIILTIALFFKASGIKKSIHTNEAIEISFVEENSSSHKKNSSLNTKNPATKNMNQQTKKTPDIIAKQSQAQPSKKINFTGKTSAEILEHRLNKSNIGASTTVNNSSNSYFKDNEFRPTKDNYDTYAESGAHGYLEKGGITKIFENNKFYAEIWKRVRSSTGFPKDFLNFRFQGQVRIHALVNNKGELIGDFLNTSSENPILELYSMAILTSALSKPLDQRYWAKDNQIPVVFEFNFNLVMFESDEYLYKKDSGSYSGNTFEFTTTRYVKPPVVQYVDHLVEDFFPPVLILPGMIYIDLIALYNKYHHWKKNGLRRESTVKKEEYENIRKEILAALKTSKPDVLQALNKNNFYKKNETNYQYDNNLVNYFKFKDGLVNPQK